MRSYRINTDRLVNQFVPHYLGGRKLILFLQSCLQPLNSLNMKWSELAFNMRVDAAMTSQIILFEHYLNRKFRKYFQDSNQRLVITDGVSNGVPVFIQDVEAHDGSFVLYKSDESMSGKTPTALRYANEQHPISDVSFAISCPAINLQAISEQELTAMITYCVKRYCIAGKKFKVIYNKK